MIIDETKKWSKMFNFARSTPLYLRHCRRGICWNIWPDAWIPAAGDRMVVDTQENIGYLIHDDGEFVSFPVLTGQRRVVHYIGRTYYAATPEQLWTAKSVETKGRSMTFGEKGTFVRLYDKNDERTAYGIHSHLTFQKMLEEGDRYRSMGCVLVSEDILTVIVKTFKTNGQTLSVKTVHGVALSEQNKDIATKPVWLGF
jgi:L,D-transpeptidase catalytic domain